MDTFILRLQSQRIQTDDDNINVYLSFSSDDEHKIENDTSNTDKTKVEKIPVIFNLMILLLTILILAC